MFLKEALNAVINCGCTKQLNAEFYFRQFHNLVKFGMLAMKTKKEEFSEWWRDKFRALPRFSFWRGDEDEKGAVMRVPDNTGNWIERQKAAEFVEDMLDAIYPEQEDKLKLGWVDINKKKPENHEFQYLFWNSETENYEIHDSCDVLKNHECKYYDELGMNVVSNQPYYIQKGITHWRELEPPEPSARLS